MTIFESKKYYFLLFMGIVNLLVSCQQYHQMPMYESIAASDDTLKQNKKIDRITFSPYLKENNAPQMPICAVVLLHGLNMDSNEPQPLAQEIKQSFNRQILIIQPKCREGFKSVKTSTDNQAKEVLKEIKQEIREVMEAISGKCTDREIATFPINIIGYSHGGVVACLLAEIYRNELNIVTLSALHAPLSGVAVLQNSWSDVHQFIEKGETGLGFIDSSGRDTTSRCCRIFSMYCLSAALNWPILSNISRYFARSLEDLYEGSSCMEHVRTFIRAGNHEIPVLLMTGYVDDLSKNIRVNNPVLNQLQITDFANAYALFTTREVEGEHDILIPIKSQLCRSSSFTNLASCANIDSVYPTNIQTHISKDEFHCYNLMAILSDNDAVLDNGQTLFHSSESISKLMHFLFQHNKLKWI